MMVYSCNPFHSACSADGALLRVGVHKADFPKRAAVRTTIPRLLMVLDVWKSGSSKTPEPQPMRQGAALLLRQRDWSPLQFNECAPKHGK